MKNKITIPNLLINLNQYLLKVMGRCKFWMSKGYCIILVSIIMLVSIKRTSNFVNVLYTKKLCTYHSGC